MDRERVLGASDTAGTRWAARTVAQRRATAEYVRGLRPMLGVWFEVLRAITTGGLLEVEAHHYRLLMLWNELQTVAVPPDHAAIPVVLHMHPGAKANLVTISTFGWQRRVDLVPGQAADVELPMFPSGVVPLTIDADAFKTAGGDLAGSLRLICDKVHSYGDIPVGKKK